MAASPAPLRLLLVDDEPLARQRLRTLVERLDGDPPAVVAGEAGDAEAAERWLDANDADAVLLDIRLPGLAGDGGLRLAERLRRRAFEAPAVIFVTAHAEHALAAFELAATDYLTKPVRLVRLQVALRRVRPRPGVGVVAAATAPAGVARSAVRGAGAAGGDDTLEAAQTERTGATAATVPTMPTAPTTPIAPTTPTTPTTPTAPIGPANPADPATGAGEAPPPGPALVIAERGRLLRLPLSELTLLRAEHKQVVIRTATRAYRVDDSLSELERRLAALGGGFVRVHRNALVALAAVRAVELRQTPAAPPSTPIASGVDDPLADLEEGWAVCIAPSDEWVPVSRRQVPTLKAALVDGRGD